MRSCPTVTSRKPDQKTPTKCSPGSNSSIPPLTNYIHRNFAIIIREIGNDGLNKKKPPKFPSTLREHSLLYIQYWRVIYDAQTLCDYGFTLANIRGQISVNMWDGNSLMRRWRAA